MSHLIIPAFFAGVLTFLAPCTLPLVPGYLAFISGVPTTELQAGLTARLRRKIFYSGLLYVIGFSVVFILMGMLVGLGGASLIKYRDVLTRIGGVFVAFFGLYLLGLAKLPMFSWLSQDRGVHAFRLLRP